MNASFGRHSGRGNRRENYYQLKRQDSNDSSKLNELMRKSAEGRLKSPGRGGQPRHPNQGRQQRKDYNTINPDNDYESRPSN